MSNTSWCFTQGFTRPYFSIQIVTEDDRQPVDLTSKTVTFDFRKKEDTRAAVADGACTITDPTDGRVEYRWGASDLNVPGIYDALFTVHFADNTTQPVWVRDVLVQEKLG